MNRAAIVWAFAANLVMAEVPREQSCARCHPAEVRSQASTPMAHALAAAQDCIILSEHPVLSYAVGIYKYSIRRDGRTSIYMVSDGKDSIRAPILWAFGLGAAGQTYVYEYLGAMYESRVSYYETLHGLDLTMGAATNAPRNLEEAAGRKMDAADRRDCFGCHAGKSADIDPGVHCDGCHENAARHAEGKGAVAHLKRATTEDISNLCGTCHRTWAQIAAEGPHGIVNVRFQPYRLTNSKCYDTADRRIACTACHDPHSSAARDPSYYDGKCAACHATAKPAVKNCTVAKARCVSCHMPKVELPGAHFAFTDHMIRIARAGKPYPQ
jgi:hypothetical protein